MLHAHCPLDVIGNVARADAADMHLFDATGPDVVSAGSLHQKHAAREGPPEDPVADAGDRPVRGNTGEDVD